MVKRALGGDIERSVEDAAPPQHQNCSKWPDSYGAGQKLYNLAFDAPAKNDCTWEE